MFNLGKAYKDYIGVIGNLMLMGLHPTVMANNVYEHEAGINCQLNKVLLLGIAI